MGVCHGTMWRAVGVESAQQCVLEGVCAKWCTASDAEIAAAKAHVLALFDSDPSVCVKGMPFGDFLYLRTEALDRHFFMPTSGRESHALCYDGQSDMQFAPCCTFDVIKMQALY